MLRFKSGIVLTACLSVTASGFGQSSDDKATKSKAEQVPAEAKKPKEEKKSQSTSPRNQVNNRFNSRSPNIGQPLPDVSAFDASGKPFKLSSLKGKYTVLVFGCLT